MQAQSNITVLLLQKIVNIVYPSHYASVFRCYIDEERILQNKQLFKLSSHYRSKLDEFIASTATNVMPNIAEPLLIDLNTPLHNVDNPLSRDEYQEILSDVGNQYPTPSEVDSPSTFIAVHSDIFYITFSCERTGPGIIKVLATIRNISAVTLYNVEFQCAVPKYIQMQFQHPNFKTIAPNKYGIQEVTFTNTMPGVKVHYF